MKYSYAGKNLDIKRYPYTTNRSLQPWNAADEHLLTTISELKDPVQTPAISNDRFGFLATALASTKPLNVSGYKSQLKATSMNLSRNEAIDLTTPTYSPLDTLPEFKVGVIKVPKSMDYFRLLLQQQHRSLQDEGSIYCGFMTRYFSAQMLEIAGDYFEHVEQSKAWKKSRVLILSGKKVVEDAPLLQNIPFNGQQFQQYLGVFSGNQIDFATQFFLEHLSVKDSDKKILDLASGSGVIAAMMAEQKTLEELHLVDDSFLAVESSRLNLKGDTVHFHYNDQLTDFKPGYFDLIVSNPPFHFEHENNIEVTLDLFTQVLECLKPNGRFSLVASKHLNFKTHLDKLFASCTILKENDKFVIYECVKG